MTEAQRKFINEQISRVINARDTKNQGLRDKCARLETLKLNPAVIEYLQLTSEVETMKSQSTHYNRTDEEIAKDTFSRVMHNDFKCQHPIWVYVSSNYLKKNWFCEHDDEYIYFTEDLYSFIKKYGMKAPQIKNSVEFLYNVYFCLECGETIKVKDWKKFEEENIVLKNQEIEIERDKFMELYYQLLYSGNKTIEEAKSIIRVCFKEAPAKGLARKRTRDYYYKGHYCG